VDSQIHISLNILNLNLNVMLVFISAGPVPGSHRLLPKRLRYAGQEFDGCLPNSSKPWLARPIFSSQGVDASSE
jgi:hypothetical protein